MESSSSPYGLVEGVWSFNGAFPRWCEASQGLYWADTLAPATQGELRSSWQFQERISAFCWDAKGESLFAVGPDSGTLFVMQAGASSVRRFASLPKGSGRLSGLALDDQGGVWTTLRDGWSLVRFSEDGGLDRTIGLPVPSPTDLAFAGPNKDMLYITSSRHDLTMETLGNAPASGRLFRIRPELTGLVARRTDWRG